MKNIVGFRIFIFFLPYILRKLGATAKNGFQILNWNQKVANYIDLREQNLFFM